MTDANLQAIRRRTILAEHSSHCVTDTMALLAEVERLRSRLFSLEEAVLNTIINYDDAKKEKYDELCWLAFDGVEQLRAAL